jgi:hypothetical protein
MNKPPKFTSLLIGAFLAGSVWFVPLFTPLLSAQNDADKSPAAKPGDKADNDAPKEDAAGDTEAKRLLAKARERLNGYRSIKADLIERIALQGRSYDASGTYLQGSKRRLKLEFNVRVGSFEGSMLEVCDGEILWNQYKVSKKSLKPGDKPEETITLTRRDVRQILDAARRIEQLPENIMVVELGLGGLPALLASIDERMTFDQVRTMALKGKTLTVLEGGWNEAMLKALGAAPPEEGAAPAELPPHVPDRVRIYFENLDKDNLFPRRIQYLKKRSKGDDYRAMLTLDFDNVRVNEPVNEAEFDFVPPDGVYQDDVTKSYLDQLQPAPPPGGQAPGGQPAPKKQP